MLNATDKLRTSVQVYIRFPLSTVLVGLTIVWTLTLNTSTNADSDCMASAVRATFYMAAVTYSSSQTSAFSGRYIHSLKRCI